MLTGEALATILLASRTTCVWVNPRDYSMHNFDPSQYSVESDASKLRQGLMGRFGVVEVRVSKDAPVGSVILDGDEKQVVRF